MAKWTKDQIKANMLADNRWMMRGLLAIYAHQTPEEQTYGATVEDNGYGFNGVDAEILTSIAQFYIARKFITPGQLAIVRKKMVKYASQLAKIANGAAQ